MTSEDLVEIICDAIRVLYVISGRAFQYSEDKIIVNEPATDEEEKTVFFADDLALDEQEWILLEGEVSFYNLALSNVDDLQSYTTDAMAVTHGDKPYKNIKSTVEDRQAKQAVIWTRMVRFNQLGVSE